MENRYKPIHPASVPWAAVAPIVVLVVCFIGYCLYDLVKHPHVRRLPRWAWVLICFASMPLGGISYLLWGRSDDR
jgi:hypothetical protein